MRLINLSTLAITFFGCFNCMAQETPAPAVIVEISTPAKRSGYLGTVEYKPTFNEFNYVKKITEKPVDFWSHIKMPKPPGMSAEEFQKQEKEEQALSAKMIPADKYTLAGQAGEYASWFGIVRKSTWNSKTNTTTLLIEHKYFDGLNDTDMQLVSIFGAGDFQSTVPGKISNIPLLSLVALYGKISLKDNSIPELAPEYIRVWDWGLFTFMDYGTDKSNSEWVKLRSLKNDFYNPRPNSEYYESLLGKRITGK